jgi:hypothetical protein
MQKAAERQVGDSRNQVSVRLVAATELPRGGLVHSFLTPNRLAAAS